MNHKLVVYDLIITKVEGKEEMDLDELKERLANFRIRQCDFNKIIEALVDIGYLERVNKQTVRKVI